MDLREFLWAVITTDSGWLCLSHATADKNAWKEEWFGWPDDLERILSRVEELKEDHNIYFSPYLFESKRALKSNVLSSRTIVADLDEANLLTVPIRPTIAVETSPERHQGYWVLRQNADTLDKHEELSKRLTYAIPRCDRTGWFIGKRVRLPGTYNFKYASGPKEVRIVDASGQKYNVDQFDMLPTVPLDAQVADEGEEWIDEAEKLDMGPQEILAHLRTKLPAKVVATYDREQRDRSAALWALTTAAFRAGASREQVYQLAKNSANNKFADLKYGGRRELAKDIIRAESSVKSKSPDLRTRIQEIRRMSGLAAEKRAYISQIVREHLAKIGQFIHCVDDSLWYVREDTGRPIPIVQRNESLYVLLETLFGINATESEANYIVHSLIAYTSELTPTGTVGSLSYYDTDGDTLFLHTGRRDVLKVTGSKIETVINGYQGIVFPWSGTAELLQPTYAALKEPWYETMFGDCLNNLVGLPRESAMALLRAWVVMLVLRNAVVSRPILALFGQPGAGKSTLFRRIYVFLYGRSKSLNAVSTVEDFDFATSADPLVVLDNVDTWERWLPDRLALAAASSDLTRRKLYTNSEVVTVKRQALLGITAHNPKFGREDVTDRLVLLTFERLQSFKPETDILATIYDKRNAMWGAILKEVQQVLGTPYPDPEEVPQFRVEDFARFGYWVTKALGVSEEFRKAINSMRIEQRKFSLEEDHILIDAIETWLKKCSDREAFRTPGQLWPLLEVSSKDQRSFSNNYRNAISLGKKLWALQESLRAIYNIEWKFDEARGSRAWRFLPKEE